MGCAYGSGARGYGGHAGPLSQVQEKRALAALKRKMSATTDKLQTYTREPLLILLKWDMIGELN